MRHDPPSVDGLTGLFGREGFFRAAAEMINAREPGFYVLACLDIEKFKLINDQYGIETGNALLCSIARILESSFIGSGGICSRITDDDFAVLYPKELNATEILSKICERAGAAGGGQIPLTLSVGCYAVEDVTLPVGAMYDRAMLAQAAAKGHFNRNVAVYDKSMREYLLRERQITGSMKHALESGALELWLQPQYDHSTGVQVGGEVLIRWRHPEDGRISLPKEFIPLFERNGFIYEMDKYVLEESCALLRRWMDVGREPLPISVNLSRYDLLQADLVETVSELLQKYAIPAQLLRLEITESAFAESSECVIQTARRLIDRGFTVEIDDFGSGYSSLNTLKDVPAQVLKLDIRFLESCNDVERGRTILDSVTRMATRLGMRVIAEGVETYAQADYLKSIGCVYVQGHLYARPMPVEEYEALEAGKMQRESPYRSSGRHT